MTEGKKRKSGWLILLYLSPLYLLLAWPLYKWHQKVNSPDLLLDEDDYWAFAKDEGEIKDSVSLDAYVPKLNDVSYTVSYKTGGEKKEKEEQKPISAYHRESFGKKKPAKRNKAGPSAKKTAQKNAGIKSREYMSIGHQKGYMTSLVGKIMGNEKVMKAIFNNSLVVNGFMQRDTVKAALSSPEALADYLSNTGAANNFLSNPVVQKALNNPTAVNTVASSKLMNEILDSPAISGLMKDPDKLNKIMSENPQLGELLMNPNVMNAIMNNPEMAGAMQNISGVP